MNIAQIDGILTEAAFTAKSGRALVTRKLADGWTRAKIVAYLRKHARVTATAHTATAWDRDPYVTG